MSQLGGADVIVYGMGSLYTSICPTLILNGVGEAIAGSGAAKVLVLNGFHDRETGGCQSDPRSMSASDIVQVGGPGPWNVESPASSPASATAARKDPQIRPLPPESPITLFTDVDFNSGRKP